MLNRTQLCLEGMARWTVVVAVVLSPWLFGSTQPWAFITIGLLCIIAAGFWVFSLAYSGNPSIRSPVLSILLCGLCVFAVLQSLPMNQRLVRLISPRSAEIVNRSEDVLTRIAYTSQAETFHSAAIEDQNQVAGADGMSEVSSGEIGSMAQISGSIPSTLSVSPAASQVSVFLLVAYFACFIIMLNCVRSWHQLRAMGNIIVLMGFVMAVVALAHKFSGSGKILWFHQTSFGGNIFGPFTNRNHFAAHMIMIFGLASGLLFADAISPGASTLDSRGFLSRISSRHAARLGLLAFSLAIVTGSILTTLSRGGIAAFAVGIAVASLFSCAGRRIRKAHRSLFLGLGILLVIVVFWLGVESVMQRMGSAFEALKEPSGLSRWMAARDSFFIIGDFPVAGSGFGTFRHIFPMYMRPDLQFGRWLHLHNDWVQWFSEGGLIGFLLILSAIVFFFEGIMKRLRTVRDRARYFLNGCLVGVFGIGAHSLVDYSLHRPANAFLFAVVAGMCLAAVHLVRSGDKNQDLCGDEEEESIPPCGWRCRNLVACIVLAGITIVVLYGSECLRSDVGARRLFYDAQIARKLPDPDMRELTVETALAEVNNLESGRFCHPDLVREVARLCLVWALDTDLPIELRMAFANRAFIFSLGAVKAAPSDYLAWSHCAQALATLGRWEEARLCKDRASGLLRGVNPH